MENPQETQFEIMDMAQIFTATNTTSQRHLACIPCRQQKVRCDGQKPRCKRCGSGRSRLQCTYPQASSKRGRPRKQPAHAVPSLSSTSASPSNASSMSTSLLGWDDGSVDNNRQEIISSTWPSNPTTTSPRPVSADQLANVSYPGTVLDTAMDINLKDEKMDAFDSAAVIDDTSFDYSPRCLTETLLLEYFDQCQQSFRLFEDKESLLSVLDQPNQEGIKYAACAHALSLRAHTQRRHGRRASLGGTFSLSSSSDGDDHAGPFFSLGRTALHQSDMGRRSSTTMLQALQATILTGLHELQQAEFGCAWLSASRALWLTEELQLRTLAANKVSSMSVDKQQTTSRAFWAMNSLCALIMMCHGGSLGGALIASNSNIHLPANPDSSDLGVTIADVDCGTFPRLLSMEEGLCAVRCLTMRILTHASSHSTHCKVSDEVNQQPYSFWTHQSQLEKTLNNLQAVTSSSANLDISSSPAISTLFGMHVKALSVVLGEVKLSRLQGNLVFGFDEMQIALCENEVSQTSLELVKAFQDLDQSFPLDITTNITMSWITYVALQSLLRYRQRQRKLACWPTLDDFDFPITELSRTSSFSSDGSSFGNDALGTYLDDSDFPIFDLSRNNSFSDAGAEMCLGLNHEDLTANSATPPSSVSSTSNVSWTSTNMDPTEAMVLDSFEALQSKLKESTARIPIASSFLTQIEAEIKCSDEALSTRLVGLVVPAGMA